MMAVGHEAEELSNMEVLAARLLHDVAGSIGSVVSYVECFLEDPESRDMRCSLEEAVEGMIARFRLVRQAYGTSEDNSSFDNTKQHVEEYLKKRGIARLDWSVDARFAEADTIEKVNRLIIQAVLFSVMMMVKGRAIAVSVKQEGDAIVILLRLHADELAVHEDVKEIFNSRGNVGKLTTHNVQAYFMLLLCSKYHAVVRYDVENSLVELRLSA
ncbi:histidine phosphotransferase ChpT [Anaplasma platys]|uniref:Histidine phosphotransferase ChpT n=1 Tax=Anaplasma platys TaxID=949 RepID=A0A858PXJ7_9RICK|nr:histidine phosphotransferase family protein [Anaplasma platys]QJC27300.1 histidine phosphotransferase ChpT [Anaplasma platys]